MIHDWIARANKYLNATGNGSLQALFATLELSDRSNITAALNLLGCDIKGQVVKNTETVAEKLLKTRQAADCKQTTESADAHQKALQPKSDRVDDPEYMISHRMAVVAFQAVMMREKAHSNEFGKVLGQHQMDLGVVICIMFEALLDYRERAHKGYFVNKLFPHLPSNRFNPRFASPIVDIELPFTPEVVLQLTDKASRIEMARRYLGDLLFSKICLLDLRSSSVQRTVAALQGSKHDAICKQVRNLTANAMKNLNALNRGESELAQERSLKSCLIRLAVDLVADRMRNFPREFEDDRMIASNLRVVFGIAFEALVAHDEEGSYFHRKLTAASKQIMPSKSLTTSQSAESSKSATISNSAATSKRTIAQTNADSIRDESSNVDHESQPAKRRKKKASKKHDNKVLEQTQEPVGNNTLEARNTLLSELDSDAESSLFIPQIGDSRPDTASSNSFFEEYGKALDKGQTEQYSVFSKGSQSTSSPGATFSNGPAPRKQHASALPKPESHRYVLQDQAPDSDGVLSRQDNDRNTRRQLHNSTSPARSKKKNGEKHRRKARK